MQIVKNIIDLNNTLKSSKKEEKKIGLVPTMGSLHEGHLSLIKTALKSCNEVWVTIFINPTQFKDTKDFETYPKDFENDINTINSISSKINLFIPESVNEIYQDDVTVDEFELGFVNKVLEGKSRPGHFDGVATIINKLFNIFLPQVVFFGEKDFQQTMVIRNLIDSFFPNISLVICPTVRNENGLALSSRNKLLSANSYKRCGIIFDCLLFAKENYLKINYPDLLSKIKSKIEKINEFNLEYFEIRDEITLEPFGKSNYKRRFRGFICVKVEGVRLIDNLLLD